MEEEKDKGFSRLKRRSVRDNIDRIVNQYIKDSFDDRESEKSVSWYVRDKIKDGLLCEEVDEVELWNKFNNCGFRNEKKCRIFWCNRCRDKISREYESRVWKNIKYCESNNNDLNMLSGVVGLNSLDSNEIIESLFNDRNRWKRVKRRLDKIKGNRFIISVYEFELINGLFLMNSKGRDNEFKKKMIRGLLDLNKKFRVNDIFIFNHFHSISNLSKDELIEVCENDFFNNGEKKYNKMSDCGLYVRKFIKKNSLEKNVRKLSNYNFKSVDKFKYNFVGSNYKYGEKFNKIEMGMLMSLYDKVSGRSNRRLFREINNF